VDRCRNKQRDLDLRAPSPGSVQLVGANFIADGSQQYARLTTFYLALR
jgi:hypothetical protein